MEKLIIRSHSLPYELESGHNRLLLLEYIHFYVKNMEKF